MKATIYLKNKMACISFAFKALCLSLLVVAVTSRPDTGPQVFDVQSYGAKGDGQTDNTNVSDIFLFSCSLNCMCDLPRLLHLFL